MSYQNDAEISAGNLTLEYTLGSSPRNTWSIYATFDNMNNVLQSEAKLNKQILQTEVRKPLIS